MINQRRATPAWDSDHLKRIACVSIVCVALGQLACQALTEGAKSDFSTSFTCPIERVEVRARPELRPSHWFKPKTPPSEVASDPGRLTMWRDEQDRLRTSGDRGDEAAPPNTAMNAQRVSPGSSSTLDASTTAGE
jgi:hypothetical protein